MVKQLMVVLVLLFMAVPVFANGWGDLLSGTVQGITGTTNQKKNPDNDYYIRTGPHTEVHHFLGSDGQMHEETLRDNG